MIARMGHCDMIALMKVAAHIILPASLLIGLPMAGIWASGYGLTPYLEFPPRTQYIEHAPFAWPVFIGLSFVILSVTLPFLVRVCRSRAMSVPLIPARNFPWWGWLALLFSIVFWILAWTRFEWFKPLQLYTFSPQWLCYIVTINACTYRRTGKCMLTHNTRLMLWLFPLSAGFWWFFEYLNRFVQNWYYLGCEHFTPLQYFIMATLPFSTVLPAVLSTEEWLSSHPQNHAGLDGYVPIALERSKVTAWAMLILSMAGLLLIGRFPDYLYPLVWVAPLILLIALQQLLNRPPFFPELAQGDWQRVYRFALAALICGFFWELWNYHSLAKWVYTIPYLHRFQLFEMPILGYAGYLPFGLECAVIAQIFKENCRRIS